MLRYLGVEIEQNFLETENGFVQEIYIDGNSKLAAKNIIVPSDISSAAFFMVAAGCLENSEIILENVGLNPTRAAILETLQLFGANIETLNQREVCNETVGDIQIYGRKNLKAKAASNLIAGDVIANLIDEIPILAVFGTQIENGLEIRGAEELRVKESDRIAAIVENLRRMNAQVEEFPDGFRVEKSNLKGATVDSFGDHRIAMAFAVAALFAGGETEILGADCAGVSFPEFFQMLASLRN
jgi:3-phosphoshikimate 1-carboxyvinyltransferase